MTTNGARRARSPTARASSRASWQRSAARSGATGEERGLGQPPERREDEVDRAVRLPDRRARPDSSASAVCEVPPAKGHVPDRPASRRHRAPAAVVGDRLAGRGGRLDPVRPRPGDERGCARPSRADSATARSRRRSATLRRGSVPLARSPSSGRRAWRASRNAVTPVSSKPAPCASWAAAADPRQDQSATRPVEDLDHRRERVHLDREPRHRQAPSRSRASSRSSSGPRRSPSVSRWIRVHS